MPRDLDPAIHELEGCYLYDIDDLESVVEREPRRPPRGGGARRGDRRGWRRERFARGRSSLDVVPAIAELRERAEEIRAGELARVEGALERLSESERRVVESVTARIVNKLLHLPTVRLKEAAAGAEGAVYADAMRHLFGLDER